MDYKEKTEEAKRLYKSANDDQKHVLEILFPELAESEDERIRKGIIRNLQYLMDKSEGFVKEDLHEKIAWLEKQGEQKQIWEPTAAQLIVIKDLIEDKNTSKANKVILRGMLNEFKQFTNINKREIDDAYLQGISDAKHEPEKRG